jgi:tetratricopeptide (TPR) repeat protein
VSGTASFEGSNRPASQVVVRLWSYARQIFRRVLTDHDGRFEVKGLPDGAYEIAAEEAGCDSERVTTDVRGSVEMVALHLRPYVANSGRAGLVSVRELKIPGKAQDEYQKGLERLAKEDFAASLPHLRKATNVFPGYFEAYNLLGVAEMKLGQLEKAVEAFQRSIDLSEGRYSAAIFGMGFTSYLQGRLKEAEGILRRGLEMDDNSPDGYFYLGLTLFLQHRMDEAEESARAALLRKPDYAPAFIVLANVYGQKQAFQQQLEAMDKYLKLRPTGLMAERVKQARQKTQEIVSALPAVN